MFSAVAEIRLDSVGKAELLMSGARSCALELKKVRSGRGSVSPITTLHFSARSCTLGKGKRNPHGLYDTVVTVDATDSRRKVIQLKYWALDGLDRCQVSKVDWASMELLLARYRKPKRT
ncbi:MAG: hypothetical protein AB7G93_16965 [Bdellovibrionales bacterium]